MGSPSQESNDGNRRIRTDYPVWVLCSVTIFGALCFVPHYNNRSVWKDIVGLIEGQLWASEGRVVGLGLLYAVLAAVIGLMAQFAIVDLLGRWTGHRPPQGDDYDDKPRPTG